MTESSLNLAVVFRTAPHGSARGREGLDLLLLSASYDQQCAAVFIGDGVYQLCQGQQPGLIDAKDYIATFKALPLYDVDTVVVCAESLQQRGLTAEQLVLPVSRCTPSEIAGLLANSQQVLTF
ncbi:sulfur relay protein TusC/DsrF [Ferrimonas balearica DSM 9799]|uniref:Sulfur relay protein TusC/DsrF n=1 Tax=Ferrimonas balearica (strain DSM 9799 / CCM 4581 / KCTC 23876 / PAT) TaxID=550540 RepID=E1SSK0_FERBD|nr:sulfurtransferase complex subunit TusC [Ferrimonas balearica]ADN76029.1 sulfur relay protein TusC/DsrF [Ferrimonas balearica DSM 9799]MBY5979721.1 sulfurtransferase complex subunit TusC [Ferrimonas balearica]